MNCEEWGRQLELWFSQQEDEETPGTEPPRALAEHAAACPECGRRLQAALLLVDGTALRALPPPGLAERVGSRLLREASGGRRPDPQRGFPKVRVLPPGVRIPARILVPAAAALIAVATTFVVLRATRPVEPAIVRVLLVLEAPRATQVSAVGDWNAWDPQANPLSDTDGDGIWTVEIEVPRGAELRYQFLIDQREWVPDPRAPFQVDDGFGGTASVLQI